MFTILGGDGQEYGPATTAQIRGWIAAGRANLDTKAKTMGSDEWQRLGDFPEFSAPGTVPPILSAPQGAGVAAGEETNLAGRGRRLLGAVIDGLIESLCWLPTSLALAQSATEMIEAGELDPTELNAQFITFLPLSLPYLAALILLQAFLLTMRSQSIGKLITGMRIVRVTDNDPGGFLRAFLLRGALARAIRHIPLIGMLFWIVDTCFIFREDKRCVHDLIAGTKVVRA